MSATEVWPTESYLAGLHKEPSNFHDIAPADVTLRRQLWWNLVALDVQVAYAAGLPPIITNDLYDVLPFSELADSTRNQDTELGSVSQNFHTTRSILKAFIGGKFEFYRRSSEFLNRLHDNNLDENGLDELVEMTRGIQSDLGFRREEITSLRVSHSSYMADLISNESIPAQTGEHEDTQPNILAQFTCAVLSMYGAKPYAVMYGTVRRHGLLGKLREKEPK